MEVKSQESINTELLNDAVENMERLGDNNDTEWRHIIADKILCDVLKKIGYGKLVEAYEKLYKWYA